MHRLKHSNFLIFLCLILVRLYVKVPLQVTLSVVYQQIQIPASVGRGIPKSKCVMILPGLTFLVRFKVSTASVLWSFQYIRRNQCMVQSTLSPHDRLGSPYLNHVNHHSYYYCSNNDGNQKNTPGSPCSGRQKASFGCARSGERGQAMGPGPPR